MALAAAARALTRDGMDSIARHEATLTRVCARAAAPVARRARVRRGRPGAGVDRVGVIPFNVEGVSHGLVAAVLGYEHGIGVRSGCFCAQPYVAHLLG